MMANAAAWQRFASDKHDFFKTVKNYDQAAMRAQDEDHGYGFTGVNERLIRDEFTLMFNTLKSNYQYREEFWMYCYYCCLMLENYHKARNHNKHPENSKKAKEYAELAESIKKHAEVKAESEDTENFIAKLAIKIRDGIIDLIKTPNKMQRLRNAISVSDIKDAIAFANINRLYWFFCRSTVTKTFLVARELKWVNAIGNILGKNIDVDGIIKTLEKPNAILRFFSVGFFTARFILNAGILLQHTLFPSDLEKDGVYKYWEERLFRELYMRHSYFLNDSVWAIVNLLTNYNFLFGISNSVASWVLTGFLFFDIGLFLWNRHLAEQEYLEKRHQLRKDMSYYAALLNQEKAGDADTDKIHLYAQQLLMLNEQLSKHDIQWKAKNEAFWWNMAAASLLMAGFSSSLILTTPLIGIACFALCTFAIAMYMSGDVFHKFRETHYFLQQAERDGKGLEKARHDYTAARNQFIVTLLKNAIIPAVIVTTLAVCWQAGLVLIAGAIAFEIAMAIGRRLAKTKSNALLKEEINSPEELVFEPEPEFEFRPALSAC